MDTIKKKFSTLTRGKKKKSEKEYEKTQEAKEDINSKPFFTTQRSTFYEENSPRSIDEKPSTQIFDTAEKSTLDSDPDISDVSENPTKDSDLPEKPLHNGIEPNEVSENTTENPDLFEDINQKLVSENSIQKFDDPKVPHALKLSPKKSDENSTLKSVIDNFSKKSGEKRGSVVFSVIVESSSESESEDITKGY